MCNLVYINIDFGKIAAVSKHLEGWILLRGTQPLPTELKIQLFISSA